MHSPISHAQQMRRLLSLSLSLEPAMPRHHCCRADMKILSFIRDMLLVDWSERIGHVSVVVHPSLHAF